MTFDEGGNDYSKLTCFNIADQKKCIVLGEFDGEITAFIDHVACDDDDD